MQFSFQYYTLQGMDSFSSGKDWERFLDEARGFHQTVKGSYKRPAVFTPEIIQNIAAMGIEKYCMAVFSRRGRLPRNHTMGDMLDDLKTFIAIPPELERDLLRFDALQSICSIDNYKIEKPGAEDTAMFGSAIDRIAEIAEKELHETPADS